MISACEQVIKIVNDIKAAATGKGEIGVPLASFGGFEFMIDVHVGDDPEGRHLPVSAFITPSSGGSVLDQIEVTPESDHGRAAVIYTDLSRVPKLPEPTSRAGLIRSYTEQQVLPQLSRQYEGEFELIYVYDPEMGIGAWMRVSNARTQWCILVWRSRRLTPRPTGPGRVEQESSRTARRAWQMGQTGQGSGTGQGSRTARRAWQMGQTGQGSGTGQGSRTARRAWLMGQTGQGSGTGQGSRTARRAWLMGQTGQGSGTGQGSRTARRAWLMGQTGQGSGTGLTYKCQGPARQEKTKDDA